MKRMTKLFLIAVCILTMIAVIGAFTACGGSNTKSGTVQKEEGAKAAETTAAETTAAAEETAAETVAEVAGECPAATSVQVESTNGAYADRMPIAWDSIGTQSAKLSHSTNNTAVFIYIANFETAENLKDAALSDGQAVIQFTLAVPGEGDPVPVSIGKYNVKEWVDNYVSIGIRLTGGTTLTVSAGNTETGDFEITSVTDTEICGKFNIDEKWTKMSGEFKVPVVK